MKDNVIHLPIVERHSDAGGEEGKGKEGILLNVAIVLERERRLVAAHHAIATAYNDDAIPEKIFGYVEAYAQDALQNPAFLDTCIALEKNEEFFTKLVEESLRLGLDQKNLQKSPIKEFLINVKANTPLLREIKNRVAAMVKTFPDLPTGRFTEEKVFEWLLRDYKEYFTPLEKQNFKKIIREEIEEAAQYWKLDPFFMKRLLRYFSQNGESLE